MTSERLLCYIAVILQRDKQVKKTKDIRLLLTRRIDMWKRDQFDAFISEAIRCDRQLYRKKTKIKDNIDEVGKIFNRLMLNGKVREATRFVTNRSNGGVLNPNENIVDDTKTVFDVLENKHPNSIIPENHYLQNNINFPLFEPVEITADVIEKAVRRLRGGSGPCEATSDHWTDFTLRFGKNSAILRTKIAELTTKLANEIVPWEKIKTLMASRLIALDKNPGVRPIGIDECLRRIICKSMAIITGSDVTEVCGSKQLCSGLPGGIEGAIHTMENIYEENCSQNNDWGLLLVDANNAFNSLNRISALLEARVHWHRCSRFFYNTYRGHAELIVSGCSKRIFSKEGVTQGDPLSMLLYAIATMPLINCLESSDIIQTWYANDSSCQGKLASV
jgi:hypothetical protein